MNCVKITGVVILVSFLLSTLNLSSIVCAQKEETEAEPTHPYYLNFMEEAEKGNPEKQYLVGNAFYKGIEGAKRDYDEAFKWFMKAANKGDSGAYVALADMYKCGHSVKKDYTEAVKWYRKAAENGNTEGMEMLGDMYYYGEGVKQSYLEAEKWYRKAAENTIVKGPSGKLARLYFFGLGVKQDDAEALKWFLKAVELGDYDVAIYIHFIIKACRGAKGYDTVEGRLIKASLSGDARAMYDLVEMYAEGDGVRQNYVGAYKWLAVIVAKQNNARAKSLLKQLRSKMTKAQIAEGIKLSYRLISELVTDYDRTKKKYQIEHPEMWR